MKTFGLLMAATILTTISISHLRAQSTVGSSINENRTINISEVVVQGKRLTLSDILDSVASRINRKNSESYSLSGNLSIEFLSLDETDTLYKASIPVCIKSAKSNRYEMLSKCGELGAYVFRDSLSIEQRKRLALTPELSSISRSYIKKLKADARHSRAFFAVEVLNEEVIYHVIIPFSVRINLAVKHQVSRFSTDTLLSFREIVIKRDDWTLVETSWKVIAAKKSIVKILDTAQSYSGIRKAIEEASKEKNARLAFSRAVFTFDNGVYYPKSLTMTDNLYNYSGRLFSRAANEEGSFYQYSLSIKSRPNKIKGDQLCPFAVIDLMNTSADISK